MSKFLINVNAKVNSNAIRREQHNGREHIVIPSRTLPFGVIMNGGLYKKDQIEANYKALDGTLAPLGHPRVDGKLVSAFSPEGINANHVGAWNRNARIEGNRIYIEKYVDVEFAANSENGRRLLERIEQLEKGEGEAIHTSVAVWAEREPVVNGQGYTWEAKILGMDHDAILLDEPGAATPADGVGLMVNADQAQVCLVPNAGALIGEGYRAKIDRLERAAKEKFAMGDNEYVWVPEATDQQVIIVRNGGVSEVFGYKLESGRIVLDDVGTPVARQESWVAMLANRALKFFQPQGAPATNQKDGDMPITAEELASIGQTVKTIVTDELKGITTKVDGLVANQQALTEKLTANERAAESDKRKAVETKFGKAVAEGLTGNALDALYSQCAGATPIAGGIVGNSNDPAAAQKFDQVPE